MLGSVSSPVRRSVRAHLAAGLTVVLAAGGLLAVPQQPARADQPPVSFSPDGSVDSNGFLQPTPGECRGYTIPAGVTEITVRAEGGNGSTGRTVLGHGGGVGGRGASVTVDRIPATPGQRIYTGTAPGGRPYYEESELSAIPGAGGDSPWVSQYVGSDCTPQKILAIAGGGGGGGDGDLNGPGGTGGDADARGNDGSGSGTSRAGGGGAPGTDTTPGAGGAGGSVMDPFDLSCFLCTTYGQAGTAGQNVSLPTSAAQYSADLRGRQTGGLGGQEFTGGLQLLQTWGGSGGAGFHGGGGGGASHGTSSNYDGSGPLAGAGSGGGGGGASSPLVAATLSTTIRGAGTTTSAFVEVQARWSTTTTVTSSANPAQPGEPVTLTATVAAVNPFGTRQLTGGTVTFTDLGANPQPGAGGTKLGTVPVVVGADGRVTATVAAGLLAGGTHRVRAAFSGYTPFDDGVPVVLTSSGSIDQVVVSAQTLSFTSTPGARAAFGDPYSPTAVSSSGLPVTVTADPSAAGVCAVDAATRQVTFLRSGTCVLDADQPGSPAFFAAPRVQQSFSVAPGTPPVQQVITFTSTPPADPVIGSTYTVSAVGGGSGNPVTFRADSVFGSCFQTGPNLVRVGAGGSCRVTASQAGGRGFLAATATQDFFVGPAAQAIEFRSTAPANLSVGDTYTVVVAVDSARLATFGTGPGSTACSVVRNPPTNAGNATSSAVVTATSPGTCVVTAQETTNDIYHTPSPIITQTFTVGTAQTVTFTSDAPTDAVVGGSGTVTVSGGGSGLPVVIGSTTPLTCAVSGSTVTYRSSGLCTLTADQAGTTTYAPGRATRSLFVGRGTQALAFTSVAPTGAVAGATYTPTVAGGRSSAGPRIGTTTPSTCLVRGGVVTFTAAGTCTVTADQGEDLDYTAAPQVTQDVAVGRTGQTIAFSSTPPVAVIGATYAPTVSGGPSSAPVVLGTTTPTTCSVTGGTVAFTGAGTCTVTADQAGDDTVADAPQITQDVVVGRAAGTVAFGGEAPTDARVGGSSTPVLVAGPSSATPVLGASGACSVGSAGAVTYDRAGTCTLTLDQAGDATHDAAPQAVRTITVGQGAQAVAFGSAAPTDAAVGGSYTPTVTGGPSSSPVVLGTTTPAVCTVSGGTVGFTGVGTCTVTVDQAGDTSYTSAPRVTQDVRVGRAAQTVAFTSTPPASPTTGVAYPVAATATSGLPVTITAKGACRVTPTGPGTGTVTLTGGAACTVTASQAGDTTRSAATPVTQTLQVRAGTRADLRITVTPASGVVAAGPLTVTVTVTNVGTRDAGLATTQLFVTAPVADVGGAVRSGKPAGPGTLTWKAPTVGVGQTVTYTVVLAPRPGVTGFTATVSTAVADPTPADNLRLGTLRAS